MFSAGQHFPLQSHFLRVVESTTGYTLHKRGAVSPVVGRTLCTPAARVQLPGWASIILGVKTWLSTLEIVNLSVFRIRQ